MDNKLGCGVGVVWVVVGGDVVVWWGVLGEWGLGVGGGGGWLVGTVTARSRNAFQFCANLPILLLCECVCASSRARQASGPCSRAGHVAFAHSPPHR